MKRSIAYALAVLAMLAGCATPPDQGASAAKPGAENSEMNEEEATEGGQAAVAPGAANQQVQTAPVCERTLPAPGPAAHKEVFRILQQARLWLNDGEEDKARAELECAQQMEADNKQVACLLRGITSDLTAAMAGESTPYKVNPGETLGSIAQRYFVDSCEFYMLARFNKMKYPKQLAVGQVIRLPGRINVAATTPAPVPVQQPLVKPAVVAAPPLKAVEPPPESPRKAEPSPAARQAEVERLYRRGREEYSRQNMPAAISAYDAVLAIDPNHGGARVGRQQAVELWEKLKSIKK